MKWRREKDLAESVKSLIAVPCHRALVPYQKELGEGSSNLCVQYENEEETRLQEAQRGLGGGKKRYMKMI